ncbi:hypothetical protein OC845_004751 [Tilletia horrida]|nr:hypothetical protein OC845_004751 [Tilletia horrida]
MSADRTAQAPTSSSPSSNTTWQDEKEAVKVEIDMPLPGPSGAYPLGRGGQDVKKDRYRAGRRNTGRTADVVRSYLPKTTSGRIGLAVVLLFTYLIWTSLRSSRSTRRIGSIQLARPDHRVPHPDHPAADAPSALIHRRLVAVADLHGDYEHALNVLEMANLIDARPESRLADGSPLWIGGHDVLVSTGDIVDRGTDTIKLYKMFTSLRAQASAQDPPGQVVNLLGNHEIMNALQDWRYVTAPDLDTFGGAKARRHAMSADGWIGKEWLEWYNITASLDLLPAEFLPEGYEIPRASFVHGGITPQYASGGDRTRVHGAIEAINTVGKSFLRKALEDPNPSGHLPPGTTAAERQLYSADGPLWYRGYALDASDDEVCKRAEAASHALGVDYLVMGHTPNFDGFVVRCPQARILLIDTGISRAYGGEQSALVFDTELQRAPTPNIDQQIGDGQSHGIQAGSKIHVGEQGQDGHAEEGESRMEHAKGMHRWVERRSITALYWKRAPKVIHTGERDVWL